MLEEIYNILKRGEIMSCEKIAEKLGCNKDMVLSMLDYLQERNMIKKERIGNTKCSGSCSKCSKSDNEISINNNIFLYTVK